VDRQTITVVFPLRLTGTTDTSIPLRLAHSPSIRAPRFRSVLALYLFKQVPLPPYRDDFLYAVGN